MIPNGFDTDRFRPDPIARAAVRESLGLTDDAILVGLVARDHPMKDHGSLIAAAGMLAAEGIDIKLALVGEAVTPTSCRFTDLVRNAGLGGRVHLLGERAPTCPQLWLPRTLPSFALRGGKAFPMRSAKQWLAGCRASRLMSETVA